MSPDGATVSVVVPVRDGERLLPEALESLLAQDPPVEEVIVVDDGSADRSAAVAEALGSPVRCLRRPPVGPGAARNAGVAAARGEFVGFLDADDRWASDALSHWLRAFTADPTLEIAFGLVRHFVDPALDQALAERLVVRTDPVPAYLAGGALLRRQAFDRVGTFREDIAGADFVDWLARARDAGLRSALISELVLWRRVHDANFSRRHPNLSADYLRVVRAALGRRRTTSGSRPAR